MEAPDFEADAWTRGSTEPRRLRLSDERGRRVALFFYPADFTFVCPTEIQAFARLGPRFGAEDAVVIAVSTDSYFVHAAWYESDERLLEVGYPVIADPSHAVSEAFGVLCDDGAALRATFIIDPDGVVRFVNVTERNVGRSVDETLRVLQALRTGELCPVEWRPGQETLTREPALVS
jgi:peroxiredoxin (alkyl hydroperoxide reductase subunit C)